MDRIIPGTFRALLIGNPIIVFEQQSLIVSPIRIQLVWLTQTLHVFLEEYMDMLYSLHF